MSSSTSTYECLSIGQEERFSMTQKISSSRYSVYHGFDTQTCQDVAIKLFEIRDSIDKNFNNEKNIVSKLNHPNIIKAIEITEKEGIYLTRQHKEFSYIAYEYARYGDVFDVITKHGKMPEILVRTLFHRLIDAVSHMHSNGIAHMDLKLENLLLDEHLNLKVTDFDLSQPVDSDRLIARGTPGYRAPEVKSNTLYKNFEAADVYSLGVILFILLTGYPPYAEKFRGYDEEYDGFYKMMRKNNKRFWELHTEHLKISDIYSQDFKDLVNGMLVEESRFRLNLVDVKNSAWFQGPILTGEAYELEMNQYLRN